MSLLKLQELRKEVADVCETLENLVVQVACEHRGIMQFANIDVDKLINDLEKDIIYLRSYIEELDIKIRLTELAST